LETTRVASGPATFIEYLPSTSVTVPWLWLLLPCTSKVAPMMSCPSSSDVTVPLMTLSWAFSSPTQSRETKAKEIILMNSNLFSTYTDTSHHPGDHKKVRRCPAGVL